MLDLPPKVDLWLPSKPAIIRPYSYDFRKQASILPGMFPAGAIAAAPAVAPPELTFITTTKTLLSSAQTVFTFTGVAIGAADPTRRLVICIDFGDSTAVRTMTACTVDGVSVMPAHVTQTATTTAGTKNIVSKLHPAGTTANIVVTINGASASIDCNIDVYRAVNETVATPHDILQAGAIASGVLSDTINIPAKGWVVACATAFGSPAPTSFSWSGLTEAVDDVRGNSIIKVGSGFQSGMTLETGRTISVTASPVPTTGPGGCLVGMSWG